MLPYFPDFIRTQSTCSEAHRISQVFFFLTTNKKTEVIFICRLTQTQKQEVAEAVNMYKMPIDFSNKQYKHINSSDLTAEVNEIHFLKSDAINENAVN